MTKHTSDRVPGAGDAPEGGDPMPPTKPGNHDEPEADPRSRAWREGQTGRLSGAGWGSEPSGGSVVDKRAPKDDERGRKE